jgi:hypothetical protein
MTTDTLNGAAKGRAVPDEPLDEVVFSTGRSVQVRKVSSLLRERVRNAVRDELRGEEPQPPLVEVDYGQGKKTIPHPADPVYLDLLKLHQAKIADQAGERVKALIVRRGVVCDIDDEAVAGVRQDMADLGIDLSAEDDKWVYVAYVCIGAYEDWLDLIKAVFERSAPTEAAITAHQESFRGNLQRETDRPSEPGSAAGEDPLQPEL